MMSYAVIQLFLHVTEHFLRSADTFPCVLLASLIIRYAFLSDTQQCRSELLKLTAGDAHHRAVNGWQTIKYANPWE
jgi:hypothetical protein